MITLSIQYRGTNFEDIFKTTKNNQTSLTLPANEVLMMRCRQDKWTSDAPARFVFLSSDSSLQSGVDFQMSLEDSVERKHAHMVTWLWFFFDP